MKKNLSNKEKTFCSCYINSGNIRESAVMAGFEKNPQQTGEKLLCRSDVIDEIARLSKLQRESLGQMATVGYQRLAFGSIADAISLLYMEEPSLNQLKNMDLFSVSEIKRPKDGAMEIKFFDRLKALEKLEETSPQGNGAVPLYDALRFGASAVATEKDRDNSEL